MELTMRESGPQSLRAGYSCPCGCTPSFEFARGAELAEDGCCCGNHFAVGPNAAATLSPRSGFQSERQALDAPWGQPLEAAWLVGPGVHGPDAGPDHPEHGDHAEHGYHADRATSEHRAVDPVCGMTVEIESARAKGLHSTHAGTEHFFCGKGCLLEFGDDPERFLDPTYVPSM